MTDIILIGTAGVYFYSLGLGISIGLFLIILAIVTKPKKGNAYKIPER